jgi:hypothetical protein
MPTKKKIPYSVKVNDDANWIWLDKNYTKKEIQKSTNSQVTIFVKEFINFTDENSESQRTGAVTLTQVGNDCGESTEVSITQNKTIVTCIGEIETESIKVYEKNNKNKEPDMSIDTSAATEFTYICEYYATGKIYTVVNGTPDESSSSNFEIKLNSTENWDYFSWSAETVSGSEITNLDNGKFMVEGGGEWNITAHISDEGKTAILHTYFCEPQNDHASGNVKQKYRDEYVYTLNIGDLTYCSTNLDISFKRNNVPLGENSYVVSWTTPSSSGNSKAIPVNSNINPIVYTVTVTATDIEGGEQSLTKTVTQPACPTDAYIFTTNASDRVFDYHEHGGNLFNVTSAFRNDCSGNNTAINIDYGVYTEDNVKVLDETFWLQLRMTMDGMNNNGVYQFNYSVAHRQPNNQNEPRVAYIKIFQGLTNKEISIKISQNNGEIVFRWAEEPEIPVNIPWNCCGVPEQSAITIDAVATMNDITLNKENINIEISGSPEVGYDVSAISAETVGNNGVIRFTIPIPTTKEHVTATTRFYFSPVLNNNFKLELIVENRWDCSEDIIPPVLNRIQGQEYVLWEIKNENDFDLYVYFQLEYYENGVLIRIDSSLKAPIPRNSTTTVQSGSTGQRTGYIGTSSNNKITNYNYYCR